MKKVLCPLIFCMSFFSYAADNSPRPTESPRKSPCITRGRNLGDTGAEQIPASLSDVVRRRTSSGSKFNLQFLKEENLRSDSKDKLSPGYGTVIKKEQK